MVNTQTNMFPIVSTFKLSDFCSGNSEIQKEYIYIKKKHRDGMTLGGGHTVHIYRSSIIEIYTRNLHDLINQWHPINLRKKILYNVLSFQVLHTHY